MRKTKKKARMNYWENFVLNIQRSRKRNLNKGYITCRKWLRTPDNADFFGSFFESLWRIIDHASPSYDVESLGGSGKARKLTGRALEDYIYHALKTSLPDLKFRQGTPISMKVSFVPDI